MSKYVSRLPDRRKAQDAIVAMSADIEQHGRALYAIFPPLLDGNWTVMTVDSNGAMHRHEGATLDAAYLAALWWPDEVVPF